MKLATVIVVVVALVVGVVSLIGLDGTASLVYYRSDYGPTLVVGAQTGPALWTRVTSVVETSTSVTITVRSVSAPLPSSNSTLTPVQVVLSAPLGDRAVTDGSDGSPVPDCSNSPASLQQLCGDPALQ